MHPPPGPPGYGYGPYPPPPPAWNGYYGCYPPMESWRPRPPFHLDGYSPEYYHPRRPPPPPWRIAQRYSLMPLARYRSRPNGSTHRFYGPTGPRFPSPSYYSHSEECKSVEITEIARTPSPKPRPPDAIKQEEGDVIVETCDTVSETGLKGDQMKEDDERNQIALDEDQRLQEGVEVDVEAEQEADEMIQRWIETGQVGESDPEAPEPSMEDEKKEPKKQTEVQETGAMKTRMAEMPKSPEAVVKSPVKEQEVAAERDAEAVEEQVNPAEAAGQDEAAEKAAGEQVVMKENKADNVEGVPTQGASRMSKSPSPSKTTKKTPCANCGGLGSQKCSKCKTTYCSKECQAAHWSKHKLECKLIAEGKMSSSQSAQQAALHQIQQQTTPSQPQQNLPQASAVHGRFLAKDILEATPEEQTLDVLVTAVESPGCIYVNLIQATSCLPYVELSKLMKQTYPGLPAAKELHFYLTQVGELCAAERKGEWHRAEILSVNSPEQGVDVMLVDFGERIRVPRNNLKKLKEDMIKLPKQGVKCFLTGIRPPEGEERWSARARELLKARILKKECSVQFISYDANRGHEIKLFASQRAESVSEELISANLAAPSNESPQQASVPPPAASAAASAPAPTPAVQSLIPNIAEGSKLEIKLTYFVSIDLMYGHLAENVIQIRHLQMLLNTPGVVEETSHPDLPDCDQLVAALYTDGQWYRAKVNSITTPEKCSVYFVDYGNRAEIAMKDCRLLPAQFAHIPYQAVGLVLAGVQRPQEGWSSDINDAFRMWIGERDVQCMLVRKHEDHLEVEMFNSKSPSPQVSFNSTLADAGFTSAPDQPAASPVKETTSKGLQSAIEGAVVWVNSPSSFFIQKLEDQEILSSLAQGLHECYTSQGSSSTYTPATGNDCAALFDGYWSRGKVVECMGPISSKVFFVDFGNEAVIENDQIRALAPQFKNIPPKAMMCALDMVAPLDRQKEWSEDCIAKLKEMILNNLCTIHISRIAGDRSYVKAVHEDKDVAVELVKANLVQSLNQAPDAGDHGQAVQKPQAEVSQPTPVPLIGVPEMELPSGEFQALVIWLNDPSEIFIQVAIKENIEAYGQLSEGLNSFYEPLPQGTYQPQVGEVCVTKTEDGLLRSLVLAKMESDSFKVQFIDYGNEEVIQGNIHKLDEALSRYPAFAGKCSLSGVGPVSDGQWSEKAKDWIKQEVLNQMVTVKKVDTNVVTILKGDGSLADKLIAAGHAKRATASVENKPAAPVMKKTQSLGTNKPPQGEFKGRMLHINNPTDMFIMVFNNDEVRAFQKLSNDINSLCRKLGPSDGKVTTGDLCMAKSRDDAWYRARVIESHSKDYVKVTFVDYGNNEDVIRSLVHPLPEQLAELPAIAIHCALAGVCPPGGGQTWNPEATAFVKKKFIDEFVSAKVVKTTPTCYTMSMSVPQRNGPTLSVSQALIATSLAKDPSQQSPPKKDVRQPSPSMGNQAKKMSPSQASHTNSPRQGLLSSPPVAIKQSPSKMNQGQRPQGGPSPRQPQASSTSTLKLCIPPPALPSQEFEGRVLTVTHPLDFCVGLHDTTPENKQAMDTLKKEMNAHYGNTQATDYKPEIDDFVVAMRENMWGRAKVLKMQAHHSKDAAFLLFVDYGMKEAVNLENIRRLEAKFAQLPAMAVCCGLADIYPPSSQEGSHWALDTCKIVREKICGCPCKVSVRAVSPKTGVHFVNLLVIMQKGRGNKLNVRDELIRCKLACPPGAFNKDPSQAVSPPHPVKSPQGRSPDARQMPSNKGAFQKYQKNQQPTSTKSPDQHSQRNAKPSSVPSPKSPESRTPDVKPSGISPPIPKAQIPTSKTFTCAVVWFNHPGSFFIQPQETAQQASNLQDTIAKLPSDLQPESRPNVGALVLAKYKNDWYRAVVENLQGDAAKVMFYDYGNVETVPLSELGQMPDEIKAMPVYAIHCGVAGLLPTGGSKNWSEEVIEKTKSMVSNQCCQVEVVDSSADICQVNLTVNSQDMTLNVKAKLIKSGLVTEASSPHHESHAERRTPDLAIKFPQDSAANLQVQSTDGPSSSVDNMPRRSMTLPKLPLPTSEFQAMVVYVNHLGNFFIQLASQKNTQAITKLGDDMNNFYSQPGRQDANPKLEELCAAQFSQDNSWYRAQIVDAVSENSAKVLFLDFGNEETDKHGIIKELSEEFRKVPVMALQCSLVGLKACSDGSQWCNTSPATSYMQHQVTQGLCQIQVVNASTNPVIVELLYNDPSGNPMKLSEDLIKKNLAKRQTDAPSGRPTPGNQKISKPKDAAANPRKHANLQIQPPSPLSKGSFQGVISWVNSPQHLYIQPLSQSALKKLEEISSYYKGVCGTLPPHRPVQGGVCAALFQGDWCRAQALEYVSKEKIKVLFVDYGNTDIVGCECVRKLEERFIIDISALATACSLAGAIPVGNSWSQEATQQIEQYYANRCSIQVTGSKEGIPEVMVEITPEGASSSINQQLISKGLSASMHNGAPSTPSPTDNLSLPSPQGNNLRSVSRASHGSSESDVEVIQARLSEKDREIAEQRRISEQLKREMEAQKREMEARMMQQNKEMEEQKKKMNQIMQMMAKANLPK